MFFRSILILAVFSLITSPIPSKRDMHIEGVTPSSGTQGGLR